MRPDTARARLGDANRTPLEETGSLRTLRGSTGEGVEKYMSLSLSQEGKSQPLPLSSPLPSSSTQRQKKDVAS